MQRNDCNFRLSMVDAERNSPQEEKAIALLLIDGHPSPLREGPGVRAF